MPLGPETVVRLESDRTTQYDKDPKMAKCFDKELRLELRLEWSVHVA